MRCEEAQQLFSSEDWGLHSLALKIHLLHCPDCRHRARQLRRLNSALSQLPRHSPPDSLLDNLLTQQSNLHLHDLAPKSVFSIKKFSLAFLALLIIGLASIGLILRSTPADCSELLDTVAHDMQASSTIYVHGRANISNSNGQPYRPWGYLSDGYYEHWYSPQGTRADYYNADGNLQSSTVMNVSQGLIYSYTPPSDYSPNGLVCSYPIGSESLKVICHQARIRYLDGFSKFHLSRASTANSRTFEGLWEERKVIVIEVDNGRNDKTDQSLGTTEYYIDPASRRLLGLRQFGPESHGRPLCGEMDSVLYDLQIPPDTFNFTPPAGTLSLECDFEITDDFNYCLYHPTSFSGKQLVKFEDDWHISASHSAPGSNPKLALDGDETTAWIGRGRRHLQEPGMWFQIDFPQPTKISKILIKHNNSPAQSSPRGCPRGLKVTATSDGTHWQDANLFTASADSNALAYFGPARSVPAIRSIRISLTQLYDDEPWVISEIVLNKPPD